mgnify:CR=1 FL=1
MLDFPVKTFFNRTIPKAKFYEKLAINSALKNVFVNEIERIVWRNKLSAATLNVREGSRVLEIEVLEIVLKSEALNEAALKLIDQGIPYHILFLLKNRERYMACMGFKDLEERTISEYFKTGWMEFAELPLAIEGLTLDDVYDHFICQLNTRLSSANEGGLKAAIAADAQCQKKEQQIARLEKQMRAEKQPKRKFELYRELLVLREKICNR